MIRRLLPRRPALRWLAAGVVLALVAGAVVVGWRLRSGDETRFAAAVALAPASTQRYSWTDWAAVRAEVGVELSTTSPVEEVEDFLLEAFDRDLAATSALEESAPTIHEQLGFSPASLDWELFAQGTDGALVIMGLPEDFDLESLRERLRAAGFTEPEDTDGVWRGGVDLLEGLGGSVTPELAALQIDEDGRLLFGSDEIATLDRRADEARGGRDDGVAQVVDAAGPALSANAYTGDYTCSALSMTEADAADRTRAAELVSAAGDVHPMTGFSLAAQPGGGVRVAMAFETDEQARTDADSRSALAAGPAPGQGGAFPDRFSLGRVAADGTLLTLELEPVDGAFLLSDLNHGPVLFATC